MLKRTKMVEKRKLFWYQKDEFNLRISCFSRAKYARLLHSWTSVSAMFQITHFLMDFSHILPGLNLQTTHRTIYFWDGQTFNFLLWGIHFQFSQTNKQVNQINKVNFCIFLNFIWCYIWKHWEKSMFFSCWKCPYPENVDWIRSSILKLISNQISNCRGYIFILVLILSNI